jgi:ABC-type nitrate/sulfonate/bicarbonate transport system substrate-binding protein
MDGEDRVRTLSRRQFLTRGGQFALVATALGGGTVLLDSCKSAASKSGAQKAALQLAWVPDAEFLGYFIAKEKRYYTKEGLDLTIIPGGPQVAPEAVVASGKAFTALTTPDTTANQVVKQHAPFKIIATEYQKNPIGIMSLPKANINGPQDLVGKKVGVPPANQLTIQLLFKLNNIDPSSVKIVPYSFDPTPLATGEIDAAIAFVTTDPFLLKDKGVDSRTFLLYDYGVKLYNDTIVVTEKALSDRRKDVVAFLRASIKGWQDAIFDTAKRDSYIKLITDKYGKNLNFSTASQTFQHEAQIPLMQGPATDEHGLFWMDDADIKANVDTINQLQINASPSMFTTAILQEVYQGKNRVP